SVFADAGSPWAALSRSGACARTAPAPSMGTAVVGAAALAPKRGGVGRAAARAVGRHAGTYAPGDGRSPRSADGRAAAGAGVRRPALERCCHPRPARRPGTAAGARAAAAAGHLSARGGGGPCASAASRPAGIAAPWLVLRAPRGGVGGSPGSSV